MTFRKLSYTVWNCSIFRGEQDAVKFTNLVVAYWLNILCKRGGVSNGVIAISATLTTHSCLPAVLHFHLPEFLDPENWRANSQYLNPVDFSMWGALQQTLPYMVRSSETLIMWSAFVKLLGSDKSGHSERSDRPTVKNTDNGD